MSTAEERRFQQQKNRRDIAARQVSAPHPNVTSRDTDADRRMGMREAQRQGYSPGGQGNPNFIDNRTQTQTLPAQTFSGSGRSGGGPSGPNPAMRDAYEWAWHQMTQLPTAFPDSNVNFRDQRYIDSLFDQQYLDSLRNQGLLDQMRDTSGLDQSRTRAMGMIDQAIDMINSGEQRGQQLLNQLLESGQTTLRDVMSRLDERLGTARTNIDQAFGAAGAQLGETAEGMAGLEAGDAAMVANAGEQFGFTPEAVQGSSDIGQMIGGINEAQRAAMNAAMADRSMMYGGLDFDVSNQLQRDFSTRSFDVQQAAQVQRFQTEIQRAALETQHAQMRHEQMMQAAIAEHDMIVAQAQARYGMTKAQAEAAYQQNLAQMQHDYQHQMNKMQYELAMKQQQIELALGAGAAGVNLGLR